MSRFGWPDEDGPRYNTKRQYYVLAVPPDDKGYYICAICMEPVHVDDFTVDHILGVPFGGKPWSLDNMQPSHKSCNQLRGAIYNDLHNNWGDV